MKTQNAVLVIGLLVPGCSSPRPSAETPPSAAVEGAQTLATSLEVQVRPGVVRFILHVTNPTQNAVVLEFGSGQRYDFIVREGGGADLWRWSSDRAFTQALGTETLAPGGTLSYEAEWRPGNRSGSFTAIGRVTAQNVELEQRATFELTGG